MTRRFGVYVSGLLISSIAFTTQAFAGGPGFGPITPDLFSATYISKPIAGPIVDSHPMDYSKTQPVLAPPAAEKIVEIATAPQRNLTTANR